MRPKPGAAVPVYPLTFEIARRVARIDGESKQKGIAIPFQDLVIRVTALEFGFAVATINVRHFKMIPGLVVKLLWARSKWRVTLSIKWWFPASKVKRLRFAPVKRRHSFIQTYRYTSERWPTWRISMEWPRSWNRTR